MKWVKSAAEQAGALGMLVEPLADVPAHGTDPQLGRALDVVDREIDELAGIPLPTVRGRGEGMGERDLGRAERVIEGAQQFPAIADGVPMRVALMFERQIHTAILEPDYWMLPGR